MTGLQLVLQLSALGFQLSAFDVPLWTAPPDAETSAAVAVGLALAEHKSIEVPVSVEVAGPGPSEKANPSVPETWPIEWIRTCDQYGCRFAPRVLTPDAVRPPPVSNQAAAPAEPSPKEEEAAHAAEECRRHVRRLLFGRWR